MNNEDEPLYTWQDKIKNSEYKSYFLCVHNDSFGREFKNEIDVIDKIKYIIETYNSHLEIKKLKYKIKVLSTNDNGINLFQLIFIYKKPLEKSYCYLDDEKIKEHYEELEEDDVQTELIDLNILSDCNYYSINNCKVKRRINKQTI